MVQCIEIAAWWVNERQADNGEFGGKVDDDVELLRWWPSLILTGDQTAFNGWSKLADCMWNDPGVLNGYFRRPRDVEHASEYIADTAPGMVVFSDDPMYVERLKPSLKYFNELWTAKSNRGNRLFKSAWFGSTEVLEAPPKTAILNITLVLLKRSAISPGKQGTRTLSIHCMSGRRHGARQPWQQTRANRLVLFLHHCASRTKHFTALVTDAGKTFLNLELFSHADGSDEITMRTWQLEPGTYKLVTNDRHEQQTIHIKENGQRINISIPGRRLIMLTIAK